MVIFLLQQQKCNVGVTWGDDVSLLSLDFGVGVFHEFLIINFVGASYCRGALQRRRLAFSTCRLADWSCALTGKIGIRCFHDGKVALNCIISYIGFSYYRCISATFRKRIEKFYSRVSNPRFQCCFFFFLKKKQRFSFCLNRSKYTVFSRRL